MAKQLERQYPLTAVFEVTHLDFAGGTSVVVGTLPANAIITDAFYEVVEAFDTSVLSVTATGAATFATTAAATTGRTAGTALGILGTAVDVTVSRSLTTDTTGKVYVVIEYVIPRRQNEVQP